MAGGLGGLGGSVPFCNFYVVSHRYRLLTYNRICAHICIHVCECAGVSGRGQPCWRQRRGKALCMQGTQGCGVAGGHSPPDRSILEREDADSGESHITLGVRWLRKRGENVHSTCDRKVSDKKRNVSSIVSRKETEKMVHCG